MAEVLALELRGIGLAYGGLVALAGVDMKVQPGTVTGLIGPNGAGKTSLFDVVTGFARPTQGHVYLQGVDVTRARPARRARLGVARTFQRLELFSSLSVGENVAVAAEAAEGVRLRPGRSTGSFKIFTSSAPALARAQLDRLDLTSLAGARSDTLPTGTARLVEVARALATGPSLLLLDEPASGLDHAETNRLASLIVELADAGLAVLLVEHDVDLVMRICSDVYVLDRGAVIAHGSPAEVKSDEAVREAYLGKLAAS